MKNLLRPFGATAVAVLASGFLSSCVYDPYLYGPAPTSVGAVYSSGFGTGVNTSLFVSTGDPRWGYDPYCQSYFDFNRRCYYDPFLYGYYPLGFRPPALVGCPHPVGWRPGVFCPPPRVINHFTVVNYRNREAAYRSSHYDWARQVRTRPAHNRPEESRPAIGGRGPSRPEESYRPPGGTSHSRTPEIRGHRTSSANRSIAPTPNPRSESARTAGSRSMTVNHRQAPSGRSAHSTSRHSARAEPRPQIRRETQRSESGSSREEGSRSPRGAGQGRFR